MKKLLLAAAAVATMGIGSIAPAAADPPHRYEQSRDHQSRDHQSRDHQSRDFSRGQYSVQGHRYARQRGPAWHAPRGYHARYWARGQRLPSDYRRARVDNWRAYHFNAPPRGYQYVRVGNDALLVGVASGLIGAVIANAFY